MIPLDDCELTSIVATCGGPFVRGNLTASFSRSGGFSVRWHRRVDERGEIRMSLEFPENYRNAPVQVIRDVTKAIIQDVCYHSESAISKETEEWIRETRLAEVS